MTDYQYVVAVHADENRGHKRRGHQQEKGSLLDMEHGELLMLVPPLFSVKDLPEDIFLRPPGGKKPKQGLVETEISPEIVVPFALDFKIKEVPTTTTWKQQLDRSSDAYARTEALVKMFEERPVWAKNTLNERLMEQEIFVTDAYLRSLLFRISYYFGCGPFRNLWIKNGYDPRVDPESRRYQALDFRVPAVLRVQSSQSKASPSWKDLCFFKTVPTKRFTIFQMHDLQDEVIQAEISKPPERATCGESTGWYRLSTIQRMRLVVRIRFLELYSGDVARSLENAERKNLSRPRSAFELEEEPTNSVKNVPERTCNADAGDGIEGASEPLQPELLTIGGHVDDMGEDEPAAKIFEEEELEDEEDDEEDEEELEDDEDEEEFEEVDMQSENEVGKLNFGPDGYMDPADNIPKNYLQALLGKFSFSGDGVGDAANHPPAKADDEEYTIYEQDEDEEDD
ncbi:hypothetical protein Mp_1g14120 [Marchantia polymorpha subsp. ruderalis]|nr:hypothetical protein MARPO_0019s0182 [Marchantia polymorpha]BBM98513.1 hypothetical protein Mp_1g14120 [Marchantia polymorpha subsp. ruderalis]PTQ44787.1 hypothetical protein MARPO_0019s0182 [Marchantia polymorpha]PTQ44788.1 hypothetical protein MARPO_0019s0182 [Marchantia polymorpha]BBM98514.1 hypothetical protein Mp_1g14120 [Marchantia polymorpha subsp. ruderalis]|eukprot:PTQ44786.1 hypothetical protein MARPO_0019s0182 [Marchantia polymorpha]